MSMISEKLRKARQGVKEEDTPAAQALRLAAYGAASGRLREQEEQEAQGLQSLRLAAYGAAQDAALANARWPAPSYAGTLRAVPDSGTGTSAAKQAAQQEYEAGKERARYLDFATGAELQRRLREAEDALSLSGGGRAEDAAARAAKAELDKWKSDVRAAQSDRWYQKAEKAVAGLDQQTINELSSSRFGYLDQTLAMLGLLPNAQEINRAVGTVSYDAAWQNLREKGYSDEQIRELREYVEAVQNEERAAERRETAREETQSGVAGAIGTNAAAVLSAPARALGLAESLRSVLPEWLGGYHDSARPMDVNSPYRDFGNYKANVSEATHEMIDNPVGEFVYDAGVSAIESAYNMMLAGGIANAATGGSAIAGGLGGTASVGGEIGSAAENLTQVTARTMNWVMGSEVASDAVADEVRKGHGNLEALMLGVIRGAIEGVTEQYSVGEWLNEAAAGKAAWKVLAAAAGAEGMEEVASNWLNYIVDYIAEPEEARELTPIYEKYKAQGMSDAEALGMALLEHNGTAFLSGALSGFAMSGTAYAGGSLQQMPGQLRANRANRAYGQFAQTGETVGQIGDVAVPGVDEATAALIESGLESPEGTESRRLAETALARAQAGQEISARMRGELAAANAAQVASEESAATEEAQEDKAEEENGRAADAEERGRQVAAPTERNAARAAENVTMTAEDRVNAQIDAEERSLDAMERTAAGMGLGENGAAYLRASYRGGDAAAHLRDYVRAYNAGVTGEELGTATGTQQIAWNAGRMDAAQSVRDNGKAVVAKKPGLVRDASFKAANISAEQERALDVLGRVTGSEIRFGRLSEDENARYDARSATITVNVNAKDPVMAAATHEIVHRIRDVSPEAYKTLRQFVVDNMSDRALAVSTKVTGKVYNTNDVGYITEEMVANAFGRMAENNDLLDQFVREHRTAAQRVLDALRDLIDRVRTALRRGPTQRSLSNAQNREFEDLLGRLEEAQRTMEAALETVRKDVADTDLVTVGGVVMAKDVAEKTDGDVKPLDYMDEDAVKNSIHTEPAWEENYRSIGGDNADEVISAIRSFTDAMIANDVIYNYVPHGNVKYDAHGPLRSNMEYVVTFDMDASCPRTFQFLNYRNALMRIAGRPLTFNESIQLIELMRAYGQQIPCTYCYVENKRILLASSYLNWFDFHTAVLAAGTDEDAKTQMYSYNAKKGTLSKGAEAVFREWRSGDRSYRPSATEVWTSVQTAKNSIFNWLDTAGLRGSADAMTDAVCEHFGVTNKQAAREIADYVAEWRYDQEALKPHSYAVQNDESVSVVDERALAMHRTAMSYAKSASSARVVDNYAPYTDQFKNITATQRRRINAQGGVRKHSSNDFRMDYVQDYFLFFADLAAYKMMGHTYTKNADYVKIFGRTGDRINISVAFDEVNGRVRENRLEGMLWDEARQLRKDYYDNVGVMAMVTSDRQLSYAMNADWIDMIIPFHASGLRKEVWYNLKMWSDYTSKQNELWYTTDEMKSRLRDAGVEIPKRASAADVKDLFDETFHIKKIINEDGTVLKPHFLPGEYTVNGQTVPGHHNDKETYLRLCREYGVNPRFNWVMVDDGHGKQINVVDHPNYMRLVKETARTETKQKPIQFNLDKVDPALGMSPFDYAMQRMQEEAQNGGYANTADDPFGIVDEFRREYLGKNIPLPADLDAAGKPMADNLAKMLTPRANQYREALMEMQQSEADRQAGILEKSFAATEDLSPTGDPDIRRSRSGREILDEQIQQFGAIPEGENPVRDVPTPVKTSDKQKLSQTVRTVLEAQATPEEMVPTIEKLTADGTYSYTQYSDKAAIQNAEDYVKNLGWAKAYGDWLKDVQRGVVNKTNTAIGWALYNNAANSGDTESALTVLDAIVKHQRAAAQAVQATRILKKLSPETQLYNVAKSVQRLQEEINQRYGEEKGPKLKVDPKLGEEFLNAGTDEQRAKVLQAIYKDIGRQMPTHFMDRWNAWRYLAMLGNPRTHVRNILGNAGFAPVVAVKDLTATAIEAAVDRVSGGKLGRTKGNLVGKGGGELLQAAWKDYAKVADQALGGGKYQDGVDADAAVQEGRIIFGNTGAAAWDRTVGRALERARRFNGTALDKEDVWFSKPHYALALAQYCKANKITPEMIAKGEGIAAARAYAIKEAQKATYRDTNQFSQAISRLGRGSGWDSNRVTRGVSTVIEGILPFRKTPANILARGVEYSPLGLLRSLTVDMIGLRNARIAAEAKAQGKKPPKFRVQPISGAEMIDHLAAGLTGTGLVMLGAWLASLGLIRGHGGDDDKRRKQDELMGHQNYALELPDGTSITLDWLAPECLPFFIGVNLWEQGQEETDGPKLADILSAVGNVTEPMLEMSCLQSLNAVFDTVGYAKEGDVNALTAALASAATSYLTQALPTLAGQGERTAENKRYTTYTDKNSFLTGDMQYTLGKASARIPGLDYGQIPYIDAWGREELTGSFLGRAFNNFINPSFTSRVDESAMEKELLRLYEATGESVLPQRAPRYFNVDKERKDLTGDEYVTYATARGRTAYTVLGSMVTSSSYKALSDANKAKAVEMAYTYANQTAMTTVGGKISTSYKWVSEALEAKKKGVSPDKYILIYTTVTPIGGIPDADGKTIDNSRGLQRMEAIYNVSGLTDEQRRYLFECFDVGKAVIDYNKARVEEELKKMRGK